MTISLLQGDCLELLPTIPDQSVDLILCDLPYGTTANKWDSVIPFEPLWEQYWRIVKPDAPVVLTAQCPFDKALGASQIKYLKYEWLWDKVSPTGFLNAKKMPMKRTENVLVFCQGKVPYHPQGLVYHPRKKSRRNSSPGSSNYRLGIAECNVSEYEGYPTNIL